MALTVNSNPTNISNSGAFNVTTSLVEDATHVNLRVRTDITVSAVVVATVEKPKGVAVFDFADILKSMVPGISHTRNSATVYFVTGGSPLCAYTILFTEVWEDASGVTQTGDTDNASGTTYRYVPAKATDFISYILVDDDAFACQTFRTGVMKFYTAIKYEYWIVFFTEVAHLELFYSKDGAAYDHSIHFDPVDGWGVIVLSSELNTLLAGVTSNVRIQLGELGAAKISEVLTINIDNSQIDERTILEYDGLYGGKEYLAFEGIKDIQFNTVRNYFTGAKKNRKPISFTGINRQKLETRFKDIGNADYLKSLLISDNVKKLEPSYAAPTDVTILTDNVRISSNEMFTNQIDIEYEY
jgi:hypothetical protein